jgi:hypothetical protein
MLSYVNPFALPEEALGVWCGRRVDVEFSLTEADADAEGDFFEPFWVAVGLEGIEIEADETYSRVLKISNLPVS